ncbi:hypothetical protein GIB67_008603 [Kingdonia uniflora]|uniref:Chaperone DnaJ C-terminal domain-containing protein n=1 Tax=Kingdonia uniflora TaxID=39325 RepID=A0A7J7M4W7_9MAGN|nr:hypothetical protein GIB67_008603 [Kingdonia uniflora]
MVPYDASVILSMAPISVQTWIMSFLNAVLDPLLAIHSHSAFDFWGSLLILEKFITLLPRHNGKEKNFGPHRTRSPAMSMPDTVTGDIVFVLQQKEHPKFKRKSDDLFIEHTLSLTEALCGFQFTITHLDGRQLLIKSNPGEVIKPGQHKAINDEGMPHYQRPFIKGRLYIKFSVEFPDSGTLSSDQCRTMETILSTRSSKQLSDMEIDECEETTLHDVNIEEEMRRKQQREEAYDEEEGEAGGPRVQCAQQ